MATYKMTQKTEEFQEILNNSASILKAASLAVGCELEQIILATDTTTVLDDILYIHDADEQVTYAKPSNVGAGEVIVSVAGGVLTTDAASYDIYNANPITPQELKTSRHFEVDGITELISSNAEEGMTVSTRWYFNDSDLGGAKYIIKTLADFGGTPDGYRNHLLDNGLVAVLLINGMIDAATFGIVGNGIEKARLESLWYASDELSLPVNVTGGLTSTSYVVGKRDSYTEKNISNVLPNGRFHHWRRFDARDITNLNYYPPTFGDASSYDGTGGLRMYHADMWQAKMYGFLGGGNIKRISASGSARIKTDSQAYLKWSAESFVPPARQLYNSITNATAATSSTVTLTVPSHGLSNGDYMWILDSAYTGGNGTIDGTQQVSNVTTNTFDITITADAGFSAWTNFGVATDDPDDTGYQHIHDPALGTVLKSWIRNGTAGQELTCRRPFNRVGGRYTCRIRAKHISGNNAFFPRVFQNMGVGGTANTSTTLPGILFDEGGGVQEIILPITLPDISDFTFVEAGFLQFTLASANPSLSHEIDIYEIDLYEGDNLAQQEPTNHHLELPLLERFYRTERVAITAPVSSGRYYGLNVPISGTPMYSSPSISEIGTPIESYLAFSSDSSITKYGFTRTVRASATVNVGIYEAILELECNI